jgi:hypothetical protein
MHADYCKPSVRQRERERERVRKDSGRREAKRKLWVKE